MSAVSAYAGIIIPAGDWTVDLSGNVNAYTSWSKPDGTAVVQGGLVSAGNNTSHGIANGLLPNFLSVSGSTRQNDLDVSFTISLQPGTAANTGGTSVQSAAGNGGLNNRQAFITFGDKSWGSIKAGKDLGIFASDAILNDMTLLGVGSAATQAGNTSLGRIGSGYIYADWKPQIAYTTPNFNGFQATVGISQAWTVQSSELAATPTTVSSAVNANPAYEGKASYSFSANDLAGKIWVSGIAQRVGASAGRTAGFAVINEDSVAHAVDIGANVNVAGFGLTGYYYKGEGIGTTIQFRDGYALGTTNNASDTAKSRDSDGGYVQATYILPTKTKVGISWGQSNLDRAGNDLATSTLVKKNEMTTAGIYHPLTKHLNLVAEYSYVTAENQAGAENKNNIGSLGAILFF